MAFLPAPDLAFPLDPSELIGNLMHGGEPPVFTTQWLAAPAGNQIVPPTPAPESGMYVWQRTITDAQGDIVPGARISVRRAEDGVLAEIFDDREGNLQKSNPFDADSDGFAKFYALPGLYDVSAVDSGLEREWVDELLGIRLVDLPDLSATVAAIAQPLIDESILAAIEAFEAANPDVDVLYVTANLTGSILPTGYSVSKPGPGGRYTVTVPAGAGSIAATGITIATGGNSAIVVEGTTTNSFTYTTWNAAGNSADSHAAFLFVKRLPA